MKKFLLSLVALFATIAAMAGTYNLEPSVVTTIDPSKADENLYDATATSWNCSQGAITGTSFKDYKKPYIIFKVDLSSLKGYTVSNATISYNSICTETGKNSNVELASISSNWKASTVTFNSLNEAANVVQISDGTGQNVGTSQKTLTEDITSQVSANVGGEVAFAIYTYTAREQQISDIIISIEATDPSSSTAITLSYLDGTTEVKNVTAYAEGTTYSLSATEKESFYIDDAKYIYDSDNSKEVTVAEGAVISVNVHKAATYNYSILSSVNNAVVASGSGTEGETISAGYPKYQLIETTLYSTNVTNKQFSKSIELTQDNITSTQTYTENKSDVVFYKEAEDIDGLTQNTYGNVSVRASNALAAIATEDTQITTLEAGKYKISAGVFSSLKSPNSVIKIGIGDEVYSAPVTAVNNSEVTSDEYNVPADSKVVLYAEGMGNNYALDYIYIVKTGEYEAPVVEVKEYTVAVTPANGEIEDVETLKTITITIDKAETVALGENDNISVVISDAEGNEYLKSTDDAKIEGNVITVTLAEASEGATYTGTTLNAVINAQLTVDGEAYTIAIDKKTVDGAEGEEPTEVNALTWTVPELKNETPEEPVEKVAPTYTLTGSKQTIYLGETGTATLETEIEGVTITKKDDSTIKFEYSEGTITITPETTGQDTLFISIPETETTLAANDTIAITVVKDAELPAIPTEAYYSWQSQRGTIEEAGGTATANAAGAGRVNYSNTVLDGTLYYTISLNGKKDFSNAIITITLADGTTFGANDTIYVAAYKNKDDASKTSGILFRFNDSASSTITGGDDFSNLGLEDTELTTVKYVIPAAADGATAVEMTRSLTGTNLFIAQFYVVKYVNPTSVITTVADSLQSQKDGKYVKDGKLYIVKNGKTYSVSGIQQ